MISKAVALKRVLWVEALTVFLFAYISLVPFYYLQPLQLTSKLPSFSFFKYLPFILVVLAVLIWLYDVLKSGRPIVRTAIDPFVVVYLSVSLLSLINAVYPMIGFVKWVYYTTTGIVLYFLLMQYLLDWQAIWRLVRALCIVCGVTALYSLVCHFMGQDYVWGGSQRQFNPYFDGNWRPTGPFGNAVFTGAYLTLCVLFAFWVLMYTKGLGKQLFYWFLCMGILTTLVFNQSRGAWLASGISFVMVFWVFLKRMWSRLRRDQKCAALVIVVFAFPVLTGIVQTIGLARVFEEQLINMASRVELSSISKIENTERFRIAQYKNTYNVLKQHPFLGVGFGNFTRVYDTYKDPSTPPEFSARTTENIYLMFAAETGSLGFLAAMALLGSIFYTVHRAYRRVGPGARRNLLLVFLAGGGGFLVNMGTWDALNEPTVRMTFWILVGVVLAAARVEKETSKQAENT